MKKSIIASMALLLGLTVIASTAQANATRDDATKTVKEAVADLAVSKDKTLEEISNPSGKYVKDDLYLVAYDTTGKCLAHGMNKALVGKDLLKLKDIDGKAFVQERVDLAKAQGSFWQDYKYMHPQTKSVSQKTSYCEKTGDVIVCGGIYK